MLGGSVFMAFLRFTISLAGTVLLFSLICYGCFGLVLVLAACVWYVADWENCVRMVAFVMFICFAVFAIWISSDPIFLSMYKLAFTFYLLAVFLIGGIEISVLFFHRNLWADIVARVILILLMAHMIKKYVKNSMRGFSLYVEQELDHFSVMVMILSVLFGIGFIMKPGVLEHTPYRLFQISLNFFLTGSLQLLVFRLYLHIGKEKEYLRENQLVKMNQRLLERNMELLEEFVENGRQIRHDARHHNAVIAEYARYGQNEELLRYLEAYQKETEKGSVKVICRNTAVNNILLAYTRRAQQEQIRVTMDIEPDQDLMIPNIDLVTILANAYENAIFGCVEVKKRQPQRECLIHLMIRRKIHKLVIFCSNTCTIETEMKNGQPKPEFTGGIGVLSIVKTAEKYDGEYDFQNDNGVFIFRLIMNIPSE